MSEQKSEFDAEAAKVGLIQCQRLTEPKLYRYVVSRPDVYAWECGEWMPTRAEALAELRQWRLRNNVEVNQPHDDFE